MNKTNRKRTGQRQVARAPHSPHPLAIARGELYVLEYATKKAAAEIKTAVQRLDNIVAQLSYLSDRLPKDWEV